MKKGLTELVFILDRSGSMFGLEKDTIGGFNGMLEKQRKEDGEANVTTVLFDDRYEVIHDRFPIEAVSPLTEKEYYARGCTALLDAVGKTIQKEGNVQKYLPDDRKAEKVIFVIITDGMENSSREYSAEAVRKMIGRQKEKYGWEFLFDDRYEVIHDRFPIEAVSPLTEKEYYARGCTALLDAVGKTIQKEGNVQKYLPEDRRAEKVIFVIITDGMENSSREYSLETVRKLIERQKEKYGWEFLFLGANMDAVTEAKKFGIDEDRSVTFENDSIGVETNFRVVTEAVAHLRQASCAAPRMDGSWKAEIEQDYQNRGKKKRWWK